MRNAHLVATFHRPIVLAIPCGRGFRVGPFASGRRRPRKTHRRAGRPAGRQHEAPRPTASSGSKTSGLVSRPWRCRASSILDGHEWTSATDIPPDVDTATPAAEPESFTGPQWSEPPGQAPAPAYSSYPQPSPQPVEPTSDKKAVVAGTLQLLLGVFGVGRFYIGSWTIGACQLGLTILAVVLAGVVPETANTAVTMIGLFLIAMPIWAFLDAILMFLGLITDGQGRKLS